QPLVTQGGAVEPTPPPKKSARRSHAEIMSSTVSRFSQAPQSYVLTPVPDGAVPRHACVTPPAMHTVQSRPPIFFRKHEGAAPDLVPLPRRSGCRSRLRLIDHERVSPRQIQLRAQPPWLCRKLARMRSVTMGAKDNHKGLRAAIRQFPSAFQQSNTVCDTARPVSLPTGRDYLPAQKKGPKQSS